jgi:hypothetical protein
VVAIEPNDAARGKRDEEEDVYGGPLRVLYSGRGGFPADSQEREGENAGVIQW